MKILIINSSGRANGNTERLLKAFDNQLLVTFGEKQITPEITHVLLSRLDIRICSGCRTCFDKGSCPMKDDIAKIGDLISDCDVLVLASPVYVEDVNGIMKNWLDRMASYSHRPAFYGKYAIVISTSGSGASKHSLNTMKNALTAYGFHVLSANNFRMGAYMEDENVTKMYTVKLSNIATDLFDAAQKGRVLEPKLFSLISFYIQQKYYRICDRAGAVDRKYWEKNGWLDPHTHFYMSIRCNSIKLLFASAIGSFLSKIFI